MAATVTVVTAVGVVCIAVPETMKIVSSASHQLKPVINRSRSVEEDYLNFMEKMKTLCSVRDDLKNQTIYYSSTKKKTMEDWFDRMRNAEKDAEELKTRFTKIEGSSWRVISRAEFSEKMEKMSLKIDELEKQGNHMLDTMVPR